MKKTNQEQRMDLLIETLFELSEKYDEQRRIIIIHDKIINKHDSILSVLLKKINENQIVDSELKGLIRCLLLKT